jgi:hypothetical protein
MTDSSFAEWCWNLPVSVAIRGAPWPFPALEILHIVGLILVFGTVLLVDLRLLGVLLRREPAWQISADLMRWAWPGFALQVLTGPLLFVANSRKFLRQPVLSLQARPAGPGGRLPLHGSASSERIDRCGRRTMGGWRVARAVGGGDRVRDFDRTVLSVHA